MPSMPQFEHKSRSRRNHESTDLWHVRGRELPVRASTASGLDGLQQRTWRAGEICGQTAAQVWFRPTLFRGVRSPPGEAVSSETGPQNRASRP